MLNPLAQELNDNLNGTTAGALLSDLGQRIYFPKGIIAQSGEAKKLGKTANGTIGMTVIDGTPAVLPSIKKNLPDLNAREIVAYAPTAGNPDLRSVWKEEILKKNPSLKGKSMSLPVLVPGLTAGISYLADLFLDENHSLLAADPSWDNYVLIANARRNAPFHTFNMFKDGKFDIDDLEAKMKEEAKTGSVRVILNFPQNPSGYSPTKDEAQRLVSIVKELAQGGTKVMVWSDDAYFGLDWEENVEEQSLFAYLADLHENVLAAKIDGPTKEDFVWGLRTGFITFSSKGMTEAQYNALEKKLMGVIRSSISCAATPSQSLVLKAYQDPKMAEEKAAFRAILQKRYNAVKAFVLSHSCKALEALPFNSGYFMSFHLNGINAETLRQKLLNEDGIGTISIDQSTLRVAFSSLEENKIETVYTAIYKRAEELLGK